MAIYSFAALLVLVGVACVVHELRWRRRLQWVRAAMREAVRLSAETRATRRARIDRATRHGAGGCEECEAPACLQKPCYVGAARFSNGLPG